MNIQRSMSACAAALAAAMPAVMLVHVCRKSPERDLIEAFITQELKPGLPESTAARTHRQPTPSSIGAAQVELGQTSQEEFNAVKVAVALALQADAVGDQSACEQALADAKRLLDSAGSQTDGARR